MVLWTRVSITSEVRRRTKGSCSEGGLHGMELQFSSHGTIHILRKHNFRICGPPPRLCKHVFSAKNKQKLAFSDLPPSTIAIRNI